MSLIKIVECPRDALQGIKKWIPTKEKVSYLQSLLSVGFDILDFGSFVSPYAIPQMKDTHQVIESLDLSASKSKLLAIVANLRGAKQACEHSKICFLGGTTRSANQPCALSKPERNIFSSRFLF